MSITSALNAAKSGLQVTSLRAEIVATNVANASTPGYVRRALSVSENILGTDTTGVQSRGITRSGSDAVTSERLSLSSDLSQSNILSSAWQSISAQLGDSLDGDGLFQAFSDFESALTTAATSPESTTNLSNLFNAAQNITEQFNSLSEDLTDLRTQTDSEISQNIAELNASLASIEEINSQIAGRSLDTNSAAALFDERQRHLDTIAQHLPIETVPRDNGVIDIITDEGVFLLSSSARTVEFSQSQTFGPEHTLDSGALSGLTVDGIDITPGAPTFGAVSSGSLSALFQLRDQDIPQLTSQLDALATDIISRVSDDSIDPNSTPGSSGLFTDTGTGVGVASRISINAAIDPANGGELFRLRDGIEATVSGPPGNNTILTNLLTAVSSVENVNTNGLEGNFSSTGLVAHLSSIVGQTSVNHQAVESSTLAQYSAILEAEVAETGVDVDTQLQELLLVEQAYAANARVIEVANQLLDQLLEL